MFIELFGFPKFLVGSSLVSAVKNAMWNGATAWIDIELRGRFARRRKITTLRCITAHLPDSSYDVHYAVIELNRIRHLVRDARQKGIRAVVMTDANVVLEAAGTARTAAMRISHQRVCCGNPSERDVSGP